MVVYHEEKCENCYYLKRFYVPPALGRKAIHKLCCAALLDEGVVMYLDNKNLTCECFRIGKKV